MTRSRILPRLYQGPAVAQLPPTFTMIVFCAEEIQPSDDRCRPLRVVRCPLRDELVPVPPDAMRLALDAAARVRAEHARGGRIYVSCAQGINRSGLVMALAVRQIVRVSGADAMRWVQYRRPGALSNSFFCDALSQLGTPGVAPVLADALTR